MNREGIAGESSPSCSGPARSATLSVARAVEFAVLFVAGPLAIAYCLPDQLLIASIVAFGILALVLLLTDPAFDRRQLGNWPAARRELPRIFILAGIAAVVVSAVVAIARPDLLLSLVRDKPWLWLAIMFGYPIASVYPQEVIYRALIFHRYRPLFGSDTGAAIASTLAFAYAHIVLWNWVAVGVTLIGGALFAWTYVRTRSTLATAIEHAVYGCFLFTLGLGRYLYAGAAGAG